MKSNSFLCFASSTQSLCLCFIVCFRLIPYSTSGVWRTEDQQLDRTASHKRCYSFYNRMRISDDGVTFKHTQTHKRTQTHTQREKKSESTSCDHADKNALFSPLKHTWASWTEVSPCACACVSVHSIQILSPSGCVGLCVCVCVCTCVCLCVCALQQRVTLPPRSLHLPLELAVS